MRKRKALVVEDDERIVPSIEDTLFSLGHKHEWVTNQEDAQVALEKGEFDYVLLDLHIPARPHRGGATTECGANLLRTIRQTYEPSRLPVIIMTGHGSACVDLTNELTRNGASEFISKPFPDKGRTLATVIRNVLADGRRDSTNRPVASRLRPFKGATIVFGPGRIEILGETIAERTERGNFWAVLQRLRQRREDGRFSPARARELAGLFKSGRASQNTVSSCIGDLRRRIAEALARRGYRCGKMDVIVSGGPGYRLNEWITIEDRSAEAPGTRGGIDGPLCRAIGVPRGAIGVPSRCQEVPCGATDVSDGTSSGASGTATATDGTAKPIGVPLNERQHWILERLCDGVELRRADVENEFQIGLRTAKRDLSDLVKRGLIEFVRSPHPGYYRLPRR